MAFPALSRRHVAVPMHRCKRRSHRSRSPTPVKDTPSASPQKCRPSARTESLRSTWMTNGSDSMDDEQELPEEAQDQELQVFVQLQRPLSDWVYWQRDALLPDCWTRVFAVFCGDLLWLYRYEDASAKSLLVRMRVTALDVGADSRQLHFRDPTATTSVQLYMPDAAAFYRWHNHVSTAVARFPPVEDESSRQQALVPAVAQAMQKKSFWKALATVAVAGATSSSYYHVPHQQDQQALVALDRGKSFGQRWKRVTTTLKSAFKLGKRRPQPQLQL